MKIQIRKHIIIAVTALSTSALIAQEGVEADDAQRQDERKIIRVCSLNSSKANQEFQRKVQLVRLQRQRVIEMQAELENTTDESEKERLQNDINEMLDNLNENNRIMTKTYGYSLLRDYIQVIEKSHIYMLLTAKEAKEMKDQSTTEEPEEPEFE